MASSRRSTWPIVLLAGLLASVAIGGAVAVAAPSGGGRPWWHDGGPQKVTGTVLEVDRADGSLVLDGLVTYEPVQAGIGTLSVQVDDLGAVQAGDTVDVDVVRHAGGWQAADVLVLDTD